jgi:PiT family inorganic phosphate transporter
MLLSMAGFLLLVALALLLAYANGSNDISKGISTLVGSGVSNFRMAVSWGTAWTVAGVVAAAFVSQSLVATFSGNGFLDRAVPGIAFPAAVAAGAIAWVLFASRTGLPVSTTHAIAGALAGAAIVARGAAALHWDSLAKKVAIPLAASPLLSLALIYALYPLLARAAVRVERYCVCLEKRGAVLAGSALTLTSISETAVVAPAAACDSPLIAARVSIIDGLHWTSSALTSFARGLNDAPKILALGVAASAIGIRGLPFYAALAAAMGAGSLIAGFRVTETLARRVTPMSPGDGFAANLVTTLLVGSASFVSLPVSTTHVCSGAIVGVGLHRGPGTVRWKTVAELGLAWVVTLPVAAMAGGAAFALIRAF